MAKIEDQEAAQEEGGDAVDDNNNEEQNDGERDKSVEMSCGKYQLRPRSAHPPGRRLEGEWRSLQEAVVRHKHRPPPLSRYRRKTANARERYRMRQINSAFESLRGVLPSWVCSSSRSASEMTKITTLRLASAYIKSLQDILEGNAHQEDTWVLSSLLEEEEVPHLHRPQADLRSSTPGKQSPLQSDFVSLLYTSSSSSSSSGSGVFQEEALPYLTTVPETEALWLGPEPSFRSWPSGHHSPLVS